MIIVDAQALLLDKSVIGTRIHLKASRQGNRPQRTVRGDSNIIGLRHGENLLALGNPACMGEIRLDDVYITLG
ncbi:hypothetical protein D3C71_1966560 [compost metagenome]